MFSSSEFAETSERLNFAQGSGKRTDILKKQFVRICTVLLMALAFASMPIIAAAQEEAPDEGEFIQILYDDAGLLSNEANVIEYTENGYIWVGSYGGLARYDSNSFVTYGDDDDSVMCGVSVRTLYEDSSGRLWIGSNEKGVYLYENGRFSYIDTSNAAISGSIRAFAEGEQGIYAASTGGIAVIHNDMSVSAAEIDSLAKGAVVDMLSDSSGRIWIIDDDSVVVLNPEGEVLASHDVRSITDNECNCLCELDNGNILIGTGGSEMIEVSENGSSFRFDVIELEDSNAVNCILEDRFGRIWICSDAGLGYMENGRFTTTHGVKLLSIEHIEEDYEGNLWLASSREGVMELVRGKFTNRTLNGKLEGVTVNATMYYEGYIFAATDVGLKVLDPKTFEPVEHEMAELLDGIRTRGLFVDSKGYLWITTYKTYGVIRYKNGSYVSINTSNGLTSDKTRVTMELNNGDIAVSSGGGVSVIRGTNVIKTYTENDGLVNPVILSMCQDKNGNMYFGSDGNGIYRVGTDGEVRSYTTEDGLGSDVILNLKYDEVLDAVWISTGSNLALWTEDGIRNLSDYTAGTGSIFDIVFAEEGKVWILRNTSVVIATRELLLSNAPSSEYTVLGRKDGLTDITSNSRHYLAEDGTLYLATSNGIYTINTSRIYSNDTPPKAIINKITVDGKEYDNPSSMLLEYDAKRMTIEFSALNYSTGSCVVEYQLVGSDEEPIVINGDKTITRDYTNLRGGTYTFRVSVTNPAGIKTEDAIRIKIEKETAFYENIFFIIGVMLIGMALIAAVIYIAVRVRTAALLKRQERYHSLTDSALRVAAKSIDAKDSYTNGHSFRVAECSREIARRLGWSEEEMENVYYMGLVHDIGKIGVPDSLLTKPSALTDEEYDIIKHHTTTGAKILEKFEGIPDVELGARYHHERYDGGGYCEGLKGEEIPIVARIIAVADAYDAMASSRVYRPMLEPERIRQELEKGKGTQFDPNIADIMLKMLDEGFDGKE